MKKNININDIYIEKTKKEKIFNNNIDSLIEKELINNIKEIEDLTEKTKKFINSKNDN